VAPLGVLGPLTVRVVEAQEPEPIRIVVHLAFGAVFKLDKPGRGGEALGSKLRGGEESIGY
jgi:hypothetical protein